jgi:superfamily II DNA or RNA helicase
VNALVLVYRRHLMDQQRERLASYLGLNIRDIGQIGSRKTARTEKLDVASQILNSFRTPSVIHSR